MNKNITDITKMYSCQLEKHLIITESFKCLTPKGTPNEKNISFF